MHNLTFYDLGQARLSQDSKAQQAQIWVKIAYGVLSSKSTRDKDWLYGSWLRASTICLISLVSRNESTYLSFWALFAADLSFQTSLGWTPTLQIIQSLPP